MPTNATGSLRATTRVGVMNLDFSQGIILDAPSFTGSYGPTSGLPKTVEGTSQRLQTVSLDITIMID